MENTTLIRVFEIPQPDGHFRFGGENAFPFIELDSFHDSSQFVQLAVPSITTDEGVALLTASIRGKIYFDPAKAYLVLCPLRSFTIGYTADRS